MPQAQEVASWIGWEVVDVSGEKIGKLEAIYLDAETDQPEWALIKTGLLGGSSPLVPLVGAEAEGENVRVNFPKDQVKDAPSVKANDELSQQEEARLYQHYGLEYSFVPSGSGLAEDRGQEGAAGAAAAGGMPSAGAPDEQQGAGSEGAATQAGSGAGAAGAGAGSAGEGTQPGSAGEGTQPGSAGEAARGSGGPASMPASGQPQGAESQGAATQSESPGAGATGNLAASQAAAAAGTGAQSAEPSAGAEGEASEVIRLRKYVVTEHVPVQHEEVRVEREPIESDKED